MAIDADDDDIELSVPLGARFNGRAVGGDTESGVGAWLYTLSDERETVLSAARVESVAMGKAAVVVCQLVKAS